MFIVTVDHNGNRYPLRGTVWAFDMDRATQHATREEAQKALDRARPFMKATFYRNAVIREV